MVTGRIKLGAYKELSRNSLSRGQLEGFFYWRRRGSRTVVNLENFPRGKGQFDSDKPQSRCRPTVRQHLILQTKWPSGGILVKVGRTESSLCCRYVRSAPQVRSLSRPFIFYDNPSSKRVARCTNILHTGATLSGVGEGQRLRKGFQGLHSSVGGRERLRLELETVSSRYKATILQALSVTLFASFFESLSSAAKIRHSARNTRL